MRTSDADAHFARLYAEHYGMVRQLCLGYCRGDDSRAGDLAQETFLQVWRYLGRFAGEAAAKTWIYRIAVNVCLGDVRHRHARPDLGAATAPHALRHLAAEPAARPAADDPDPRHRALYRALGELAEVDRLVLVLQLEGLDYSEIATVTELDRGHVRVRAHRARKRLRSLLTTPKSSTR